VSEFNLANADTSNVENMYEMFANAESFNQDISAWCVEQITDKPALFAANSGIWGESKKKPNWGEPC